MTVERASSFNPAQKAAVSHPAKRLLIVAGPGTGKTHTLTARVARRLEKLPSGQKAVAITFTNKAAREMTERLRKWMTWPEEALFIGTFHAFCLARLREGFEQSVWPDAFRLASVEEIAALTKVLWPEKSRRERRESLERICRFKAFYPEEGKPPAELAAYKAVLRAHGLWDFDDLILEAISLLEENPALAQPYQEVFVDEYQDINPAQLALLKLLVGREGRITAIGDPNQAIYGFRGSDANCFENFAFDFSGANRLSLTENYRSAANLLSASAQIMAGHTEAVPALVAKIYQEGQLIIHDAPTDKAEAEYVVHTVEKLVGGVSMFSHDSGRVQGDEDSGYGFGDVAVLFRLKKQAEAFKEAFERSGMPYSIVGEKKDEGEEELDAVCPIRGEEFSFVADKITLMTLHAAKGLEFPVVFIVGCEDQLLPLALENMRSDAGEERRLFYVGMTRAKERLYLSRAQKRFLFGKTYHFPSSPFLADIAEQLKQYDLSAPLKRKEKTDEQLSLF